jgi:hypothetical protein
MLPLLFAAALSTPALAQTASPIDCEAEAEFETCGGDWMGLGSCDGGMTVGLFSYPESMGGYSCDEKLDLVLDAHESYLESNDPAIAEHGPSTVLNALMRCVDASTYTCSELQVLARETDTFIDGIDTCDADQAPVFESFLAEVRAAWWDQCVDTDLWGETLVP